MRYDPAEPMDGKAWLTLDEMEQIRIIETYHRRKRVRLPNAKLHAVFNAVVENQLVMGVPAVVETMDRLRREGLDRHDAIHAIGSVLASHMYDLMETDDMPDEEEVNSRYAEELHELTAEGWLSQADPD